MASGSGSDAEVGPASALLAVNEARVEQDFEVVADGRLGEPERGGEVADAGFAVRLGLNQAEQPEPSWLGEHLEQRREALRVGLARSRLPGAAHTRWRS